MRCDAQVEFVTLLSKSQRRTWAVCLFCRASTSNRMLQLTLVWLPVHLLYSRYSHLAALLTNCWELWKSCLCCLTNCFSGFTCWHVCLCNPSPLCTSVCLSVSLFSWSVCLSGFDLLPPACCPAVQPCPSSSSSEMSETLQLHSDYSSPSSLAAATAPPHASDKVKNTHPTYQHRTHQL